MSQFSSDLVGGLRLIFGCRWATAMDLPGKVSCVHVAGKSVSKW
jgi:hypothetical protein